MSGERRRDPILPAPVFTMTFDEALRKYGVSVKEDVADACRMLESQGFRYGKDFVTGNAIETAGSAIIELEAERNGL